MALIQSLNSLRSVSRMVVSPATGGSSPTSTLKPAARALPRQQVIDACSAAAVMPAVFMMSLMPPRITSVFRPVALNCAAMRRLAKVLSIAAKVRPDTPRVVQGSPVIVPSCVGQDGATPSVMLSPSGT